MSEQKDTQIEESWLKALEDEFHQTYFSELKKAIVADKLNSITVYPTESEIFNAFNAAPFDKVKVVIIGQDPYHGVGQAHGLCFSVKHGVKTPPSLQNIYKELAKDLGCSIASHGNLQQWADQGVLLLNATLTVKASIANSHKKIGWQQFTDAVINKLSAERKGLVFLLWGKFAQKKGALVDASKHYILKAPHPSPFSARKGFFGCQHFSKTNELLVAQGKEPIDWQIT